MTARLKIEHQKTIAGVIDKLAMDRKAEIEKLKQGHRAEIDEILKATKLFQSLKKR